MDVPAGFATRKALWMKQLEFQFNYYSKQWQAKNQDCAYDLMNPNNNLVYHINPSISLKTMCSDLNLDSANIGIASDVFLIPAFTTAANPFGGLSGNSRSGKHKTQRRQETAAGKKKD